MKHSFSPARAEKTVKVLVLLFPVVRFLRTQGTLAYACFCVSFYVTLDQALLFKQCKGLIKKFRGGGGGGVGLRRTRSEQN